MPVWSTSNAVFNSTSGDTVRSKAFQVPISATGLKPNTNYDFFLDGIQYNWAVKPWGGTLGSQLTSDEFGTLDFYFLYDFQYEGNYAFDDLPVTPQTGSQYNKQGADSLYYFTTNRFVELKGPGSYASAYFPVRLMIVPSHINRLQSHAH